MKSRKKPAHSAREVLIDAGIVVFGRDGYAQAANRAIADTAGVNQALIKYHFGNKEGLYLAVFASIAERLGQRLASLVNEVDATIAGMDDTGSDRRDACILCIEKLLCRYLRLITDADMNAIAQLLMREQLEPSSAFQVLYDGMLGKLLDLLTQLVAMAMDAGTETNEHSLSALMLMGQAFIFRGGRATVMYHMNWKEGFSEPELKQIEARLKIHIRALIAEP
jgi:AcrR family transcriptional regulator